MKCFYFKVFNKKTGKVIYSNFDWSESFTTIKECNAGGIWGCEEITHEEFKMLRAKNI